jgi:predicted acylesterase/phospholipase RssA
MTSGKKGKPQNEKKEKESEKEAAITNGKSNHFDTQRALVFQGGGALAAYEVGVYATLYFWLKKNEDKKEEDRNIFDVIAGTSGGAINAAIIVSHVMKNTNRNNKSKLQDCWRGSIKYLLDFYNHISSDPDYSKWGPYSIFGDILLPSSSFPSSALPPYHYYGWVWPPDENSWKARWDQANRTNKPAAATGEAARRYYSAKEYLYSGAPNVFSRSTREYDNRFFDDLVMPTNVWYHYDNTPFRKSIKQYVEFPIATSFFQKEKSQPRLLMVSVDVVTGAIVTFDSYEKDGNGTRNSEFEDYAKEDNKKENGDKEKITMMYRDGIHADHVIASSSVPINYDYAEVKRDYDDISKGIRKFWDGGLLSNTPLRELIQSHENYWKAKAKGEETDIPDLEVYIANIWPIGSKRTTDSDTTIGDDGNNVPSDQDGAKNRLYDLKFHDKTPHEEKIAYLILDYINFAKELKERAEEKKVDISDILKKPGKSKHRNGRPRTYSELIEKKVRITDVTRIQRKWDPNDVSSKMHDYSSETISNLIIQGVKETLAEMTNKEKDPCTALNKFINIVEEEKESEQLAEARSSDGHNYKILRGSTMHDVIIASASEIRTNMDCK